ncbi:unnamed protein product, partial [marine sediment metagenome]
VNGLADVAVFFSELLDTWTGDSGTLMLVRGKLGEDCVNTDSCLAGRCLAGFCQQSAVDLAWKSDV